MEDDFSDAKTKNLLGTLVIRRKRHHLDGIIIKHKGRYFE
jgi:hypothetical protein